MSYTLVSAIAKVNNNGARWESVDISNLTFNQIYTQYLRVFAVLSNPFDPAETSLDLAAIEYQVGDLTQTFDQYLINIGNAALPTSTTIPTLQTTYAKYADAWLAGYTITPINPDAAIDSPLPVTDKPWLKLTRSDVDFGLFGQSCMVSVNGYFHYVDTDSTGAYVVDGMKSIVNSNNNQVGIYNLGYLGQITYKQITADMIYKQDGQGALCNGVYLNCGQDISNTTILLVIGGYLHVLDDTTFKRVSDSAIKIDWNNFPYFDRYFESVDTIDMSSLNLEHTNANLSQVAVQQLLSDEAITAYMTLSQSFLVFLNNSEVFRDSQFVQDLATQDPTLPGRYVSYVKPEFPLKVGRGRIAEYWAIEEKGQWGLNIRDGKMDRRVYYTTDPKQLNSIAANRIPDRPYRISPAEFILLGTDVTNLPS
jgi:hypothetical protein